MTEGQVVLREGNQCQQSMSSLLALKDHEDINDIKLPSMAVIKAMSKVTTAGRNQFHKVERTAPATAPSQKSQASL